MKNKSKKSFLNFKLFCIAMLSCFFIVGCRKADPAKIFINLINKQNSSINIDSKINKNNYQITIHNVIDNRYNKNNIGFFCGSEIIANDLLEWINKHLEALHNTSKVFNGNEILLNISIKKAYIKNISTSKVAIIALQVDYLKDNNLILSKPYRKQIIKVNWDCKENEIIKLLNNVMQDIMTDIINDISSLI